MIASSQGRGRALAQDNPWIIEADVGNFERDVIQRSQDLPVLVDFWATWCGPCKTLTPALEKRAREGEGRFLLAKIDLDQNPELVQAFRVEKVPTVLVLSCGRLVDGFQGALGDKELDDFLDKVAPAGQDVGTEVVSEARERIEGGDLAGAIELLQAHLRGSPDDVQARVCLVECLLSAGSPEEARNAFDELSDNEKETESGRSLAAQLSFAETAGDLQELKDAVARDPEDAAARTALGRAFVGFQDYEQGLGNLLEAVRLGNLKEEESAARDEARGIMLEVFEILGLEDPLANDYRFKLSLEIFA